MRLKNNKWLLMFVFVLLTTGGASAKNDSSEPEVRTTYEEVKYLYEKANDAIARIEEERERNQRYTVLAQEVSDLGDVELAASILKKTTGPIFRSEINSRIGRKLALDDNCEQALAYIQDANSKSFNLELRKRETRTRHHRTGIAHRNIVETFAACNKLDEAEKLIDAYDPGQSANKQYRSNAYSTIGAMRQTKGDIKISEQYFLKAKSIARPINDETHRSDALSRIAKNEIYAGLYDNAFRTALEITPNLDGRPKGLALRFFGYKDPLLGTIAYKYAQQGKLQKAFSALDAQSIHGIYYREGIVVRQLGSFEEVETEKAIKNFKTLERSFWKGDPTGKSLIHLARAYSKRGELEESKRILGELHEILESKYLDKRLGSTEQGKALRTIDQTLQAFLIISNDTNRVLDILRSEPYKDEKAYKLKKAWGALLGDALINGNEELIETLKKVLQEDFDHTSVKYGAFLYLLEMGNHDKAEALIETMIHREKVAAYRTLARERMGVSYWDSYYNDLLNYF